MAKGGKSTKPTDSTSGSPSSDGGTADFVAWDRTPAAPPAPESAEPTAGPSIPDELQDAMAKFQREFLGSHRNVQTFAGDRNKDKADDPMAPVGLENIVGYGIMEKRVGDEYTGIRGLSVLVRRKVGSARIVPEAAVPPSFSIRANRPDVPTDVIEVGDIRPHFACGSSIGHFKITWGTQGCLVILGSGGGGHLCVLSNNHILANSNPVGGTFAQAGDPILSPGPGQGGTMADQVGVLDRFVPLQPGGADNFVDAAVAWTAPDLVSAWIGSAQTGYRINPSPMTAFPGMQVRKIGARTGHTLGTVLSTTFNLTQVPYQPVGSVGSFFASFTEQIVIEGSGGTAFSAGGDSGSLIVEANSLRPVALLFAGDDVSPFWTYANPIARVLSAPELALTGGRFVSELGNG